MNEKIEQLARLTGTQLDNNKYDYHLGHQTYLDATPLTSVLLNNQVESLYIEYSTFSFTRMSQVINLSNLIVDALKQNTSLKTLILKDSGIANSLADVMGALIYHPSIQTLDLRVYHPSDLNQEFVKSLAALLKENVNLVNLKSRYLDFGDTDISELANAIANSTSLKKLALNGWKLSAENKQRLYAALKANKSLMEIECSGAYVGSDQELVSDIKEIKMSKNMTSSNPIPMQVNHMVEIADLDPAEVLTNLYLYVQSLWNRTAITKEVVLQKARNMLADNTFVTTLFDVPINVNFLGNAFDSQGYDHLYGTGGGSYVINEIRKTSRPKCIIFDRDDTLIDRYNQIINPGKMVSMIKAIAETPQCKMGIASLGSLTIESDPAILAFKTTSAITNNTPIAYAQFGRTTFANSMIDVDGIRYDEKNPVLRARDSFLAAEMQIPTLTSGQVKKADDFGDWNIVNGDERQIKLNPETVWTAKIGQTIIKIRAKEFFENHSNYVDGDCKIAAVFQILDQQKLKLKDTPELRALGFINTITPPDYKEIAAQDVIFLDDKSSNCSYLRSTGMTAIDVNADRTYISKLQSVLPTDANEKYISLQHEDEKRQELIDDLQRYINRINPGKKLNLDEINFQAGFRFFKESQATNRRANYRLALYLMNELTNRKNSIEAVFEQHEMNQLRINFGATRKINSDELNNIIEKEQRFMADPVFW